jgi:glycosyltransferase involved in cell wall biosynthesis
MNWVSARETLQRLRELVRPYYLKWLYFPLSENNCPAYFRTCWQYPENPIGPGLRNPPPPARSSPDFVFLPMTDWHTRFQRSQHLAATLGALGHRCVYLNPHLGREFPQPFLLSRPRRRLVSPAPGVLELHVHLPREPVFHERCLDLDESHTVSEAILAVLEAMGSVRTVLLVSLPTWWDTARLLRERLGCPLTYDCHDLLEGFGNVGAGLIRAERELLRAADHVIFSAEHLKEEHVARDANLAAKHSVVRNGVHPGDFRVAPPRADSGTRTIGYVGSLNSWLDVDALEAVARRHPDWRIVLVGRQESPSIERLRMYGNVELAGERPYRELPDLMGTFDVALIPFLDQPLTRAADPIKLYEYFACGLPVVATPLPELQRYSRLVYLASTPEEFVSQSERALAEDSQAQRQARRCAAEQESWGSRCEDLLRRIPDLSPAGRP